jgi:hypothetical protein
MDKTESIIKSLDEAILIGNQTLQTGEDINTALLEDRDRIQNMSFNLDDLHAEAVIGRRKAESMLYRIYYNQCLSWTIDAFLLLILIFSIWYKLAR